MKIFRYLLMTALLLGVFLTIPIDGIAQNRRVLAEAEKYSGDKFNYSARTRRGARVYAVSRPSAEVLNAIDKGLTDLFNVARKNGYRSQLKYSSYSIYIAKADRENSSSGVYTPSFAIGAAQYAGTDYDKGGHIFVAGMVISNNPMAFIIAEHTRDFNKVSDIVRYEGEHLVLYHNDRRKYNETADHSKGGGHPILK
ncbi:MAG: hypothetical protein KF685_03395 [Acidobacteria bacterium]|nr:hypothetical protein [Acidobacteriota bacterium]